MFRLGYDIYGDPISVKKTHPENVYPRLASRAVQEECKKLAVRMSYTAGGAEDRDFDVLEAAERLLSEGRAFLEREEKLVGKKTFVVDLFQAVSVPRIVVVDVDHGL